MVLIFYIYAVRNIKLKGAAFLGAGFLTSGGVFLLASIVYLAGAFSVRKGLKNRRIMMEQQYFYLITEFYQYGLDKFLGSEH